MTYATLEEFKAEFSITTTANDDVLTDKLVQAQGIIEDVCHRRFECPTDETRLFDCAAPFVEGRSLFLNTDLCQITSITNGDGRVITADEYVTTPRLRSIVDGVSTIPAVPDYYPFYQIDLKLYTGLYWTYLTNPEEAISITGRFAYSITPPPAIKWATIRLTDWLRNGGFDNRSDDKSKRKGSKSGVVMDMSILPEDVQARLIKYVKVV